MNHGSTILIVGGSGTFGLSAAWYLAHAGYKNIQCLDRWPCPSPSSAGFDRNKIVRTEYANPVYSKLAQEAVELWMDPRWKGIFYQTGWLFGTDGTNELGRLKNFERAVQNTHDFGDPSKITALSDWKQAVEQIPVLGSVAASVKGKDDFKAIFNGNAGWVRSIEAMMLLKRECETMGVKFASGPSATATELLRCPDGRVHGVKTSDGTVWSADRVVLAAGAYCETLLDFEGQLQATAYMVSHVRMSEDEYQRYKGLPVLNISRRGYSFPPNEDRIMKICNLDTSYVNLVKPRGPSEEWSPFSVPRDVAYHPTDSQTDASHETTQAFTRYILPELADGKRVVASHMCWDAESFDHSWIIGYHPSTSDSLFVATGGSGHSFKNIVNIGKYILHGLEGRLDPEYEKMWAWRPQMIGVDKSTEERASRPKLELKEATGWNHDEVPVHPGEPELQ